jgi:hypothetical protein
MVILDSNMETRLKIIKNKNKLDDSISMISGQIKAQWLKLKAQHATLLEN